MGEILISLKRIISSSRRPAAALGLLCCSVCVCWGAPAFAQQQQSQPTQAQQQLQQQQGADLPAEEIIQILQDDPQLLADAKTQIVNELRNRGYSVSEREVTDDRLFGQIRADRSRAACAQ